MNISAEKYEMALSRFAKTLDGMTKAFDGLSRSVNAATLATEEFSFTMIILGCKSNRQRRKIAHSLMCEARRLNRVFDQLWSAEHDGNDFLLYKIKDLRKRAKLIAQTWKGQNP